MSAKTLLKLNNLIVQVRNEVSNHLAPIIDAQTTIDAHFHYKQTMAGGLAPHTNLDLIKNLSEDCPVSIAPDGYNFIVNKRFLKNSLDRPFDCGKLIV